MKENINPEDFDVSYKIKINPEIVQECISEMEKIANTDRHSFYVKCVLERFDKCNNAYIKDFDNSLNALSDNLFNSEGDFNHYEFKRLLKASMKLTSGVYDKCLDLICSLNKEK